MDLETILSNHLCRILNIDDSVAENINILVINLNILHNYFDDPNKIIFNSVSS